MAFALIAHVSAQMTPFNHFVTTGDIVTSGADLIVVAACVSIHTAAGVNNVITDSKGNDANYVPLSVIGSGSNSATIQLFYCVSPMVGSGHNFTLTDASAGPQYPTILVAAFSGVDVGDPFDAEDGDFVSGNTSAGTGFITPAVADELFIAAIDWYDGYIASPSINESYTIIETQLNSPGNSDGVLAYKFVSGSGSQDPTFSWTNSWDAVTALAGFKPGGGGGSAAAFRLPVLGAG